MAARAGVVYFAAVFAVGFVLGPIREIFVVPRLGRLWAVALEAPLMLLASVLVCGVVVRRWHVPSLASSRLTMGGVALACLLAAELILWTTLRRGTVQGYLAHLATPEGRLSLVLFLAFAAMPVLRRGRPGDVTRR